ncbi:MAG: hypothetical protein J3K34DRAFT_518510 [Monoraphidium minutum]|nr:MAG: hypothetical protein J3K34DRAFT_518510 [Monoraphidium minutum]
MAAPGASMPASCGFNRDMPGWEGGPDDAGAMAHQQALVAALKAGDYASALACARSVCALEPRNAIAAEAARLLDLKLQLGELPGDAVRQVSAEEDGDADGGSGSGSGDDDRGRSGSGSSDESSGSDGDGADPAHEAPSSSGGSGERARLRARLAAGLLSGGGGTTAAAAPAAEDVQPSAPPLP